MIVKALKRGGVALTLGKHPVRRTYRAYSADTLLTLPDDEVTLERHIIDGAVAAGLISIELETSPVRIDALSAGVGSSVGIEIDFLCSASEQVGDLVYVSSSKTVSQADASVLSKVDVIGHVIAKTSDTECTISTAAGPVSSSGLTPGIRLYLSDTTPGGIAQTPPGGSSIVVEVGIANSATTWIYTGAKVIA